MSGSLPQGEILAASDGCVLVRVTVRWAALQVFVPVFEGFAHQFNAVFQNPSHHSQ
jgi:hypothetical protein